MLTKCFIEGPQKYKMTFGNLSFEKKFFKYFTSAANIYIYIGKRKDLKVKYFPFSRNGNKFEIENNKI